ncbi:alkaline phosphatase D [Pontibacter ummariensis]|uniref:Alkaline phosphatase D n=1 Tax=Pontibacter ummariensis TaxID=1610492 RepID=A0A239KIZ8_9BACT|nr:alkaline phosphatase D family protein [Pontibacter ummariensis]PRY05700.1 alkaline phosphatase D [Pontibacter ummariensis]SNT18346.1 alkaline phosphatase D [Pontibacter ummariensis]
MLKKSPLAPVLALVLLLTAAFISSPAQSQGTTRIAFGSCNSQDEPQPLWPSINATQPDLWVWLGDNIYADTHSMDTLASKYNRQLQQPGYQELLKHTPVTGTWDDHDFGYNDAGGEFAWKAQSQQLFLDFMGVPKDAPVRKQEGIYRSYTIGEGEQKVKVLLLDERYHRDSFNKMFGLYLPNWKGKVLHEAQWQWLEQELTNSDASVHLIVSGMQVLPTGHAYTNLSAYPNTRKRLLALLEKTKPAIPIILSGDRHVGELGKISLEGYKYPLYEITSSGMTHHRKASSKGNPYRIGEQVGTLNFGVLDISWGKDNTAITMQIRGKGNKVLLEKQVIYEKKEQAVSAMQ